jgi:hypothetical protein
MKTANTRNKILLSFTFGILFMLTFQQSSYSIPTKWGEAGMSMSDLIDNGWQITAHGTNRVASNSSSGNSFDVRTFSFLLTKGNKYIICVIENPLPPTANAASCRKLN